MSALQKAEPIQNNALAAPVASILEVISRAASDPSVDIDKLERLMQMQERMQAKQAEQLFNEAMSRAQSRMGRISADAENKQTRSNYATYGKLDSKLRPIYTEEGFALSFGTGDNPPAECLRVLCYVSHRDGHTRTYHCDMPADGKGAKGGDVMTKTHAAGSAMTYGQRYLLKLIFNVAIGEEDDDGNGAQVTPEQAKAAEWIEAIADMDSPEKLERLKGDCVADYGMKDKVPASVKRAFAARAKELAA